MPYSVTVTRTIPLTRTKVFASLMDFGAIARLAPDSIESCRVEGSGVGALRHFRLKGELAEMVERLECAYDQSVFSYSLITSNSFNLDHYHAVVILADAPGSGCVITWASNWTSRVTPESEMRTMLAQLYVTLIDAIARE